MRKWALVFAAMWAVTARANDEPKEDKPVSPQPVIAKKTAKSTEDLNWYASLELRHHINTHYDPDDFLGKREPSAHVRLQVGSTLYDGLVDAYVTVGVFKVPQTQQVFQRRPQLALDVYPYRHPNFTLLQYNLIQMPFDEAEQDPDLDAKDREPGTIYTLGLAPSARWSTDLGATRLVFKGGIDGWTKMYSRAQTTGRYQDDDNESRLGLDDLSTDQKPADPTEVEDYAQHYFTQAIVGVTWDRLLSGDVETTMTANYRSDYEPFYEIGQGTKDYKYVADRYSFYKWRMKVHLTERVSFVNDFYHFHDGLFAAKRRGDDNRRFRNIARILCIL